MSEISQDTLKLSYSERQLIVVFPDEIAKKANTKGQTTDWTQFAADAVAPAFATVLGPVGMVALAGEAIKAWERAMQSGLQIWRLESLKL